MTNLLVAMTLFISITGCANRQLFRPRHAALEGARELLSCSDVKVAMAPRSPYRRDPLQSSEVVYVAAWGCGQIAQFNCDDFGSVHGRCVRDEWYQAPPRAAAQAIVKVRMTYHRNEGITRRQFIRIDGHPIVQEPNRAANTIAIPVESGAHNLHLYTAPVRRIEHTYLNDDGDVRTYYTRHLAAGCGEQFVLNVKPDATYRLELDYDTAGFCEVTCQREVRPGELAECEGFRPG